MYFTQSAHVLDKSTYVLYSKYICTLRMLSLLVFVDASNETARSNDAKNLDHSHAYSDATGDQCVLGVECLQVVIATLSNKW